MEKVAAGHDATRHVTVVITRPSPPMDRFDKVVLCCVAWSDLAVDLSGGTLLRAEPRSFRTETLSTMWRRERANGHGDGASACTLTLERGEGKGTASQEIIGFFRGKKRNWMDTEYPSSRDSPLSASRRHTRRDDFADACKSGQGLAGTAADVSKKR